MARERKREGWRKGEKSKCEKRKVVEQGKGREEQRKCTSKNMREG